ncbi:unnamed protein product [Paramecium sonneborni]|uniref:NadR/Ttd14 AAA domain-containing protein n=1 Tax=Paramecium sonneborni TaxID=65129 RepID=A0A8S1MDP6_9CILI|nr:unnamed protein product [Paramecium sonneborni]
MNKDHLIYGLCFSIIPCLIAFTKLKLDEKKFLMKEQLYRKMLLNSNELQQKKTEQQQKNLKSEAELGETIEYNLMNSLIKNNKSRVRKICLTGGPCAGKTTGLNYLAEKLKERGFAVFLVPEAATTLFMGGGMLDLDNYSSEGKMTFQMNLLNLQMKLEHSFNVLAMLCPANKTPVLLCDRGLMDGKAYMDQTEWYEMIGKYNLDEFQMRDLRYDAVVHMVTAADNTDCYSTLNNKARHETQQQALQMDHRTQKAWTGHPNLIKIDNHSVQSFNEKLDWLLHEVLRVLGHPIPQKVIGKTRQFILAEDINFNQLKEDHQIVEINKTYLIPQQENSTLLLVQRTHEGQSQLYIKEKFFEKDKMVKANIVKLQKKDYEIFRKLAHPEFAIIKIKKVCFTYEGQNFIVNEYEDVGQFLKIKNCKQDEQIQTPPFLNMQGAEELQKKFTTRVLAKEKVELKFQTVNQIIFRFRKLSTAEDSVEKVQRQDQEPPEDFQLDQQQNKAKPKK